MDGWANLSNLGQRPGGEVWIEIHVRTSRDDAENLGYLSENTPIESRRSEIQQVDLPIHLR